MKSQGTFVVNGEARVIINQILRSPGLRRRHASAGSHESRHESRQLFFCFRPVDTIAWNGMKGAMKPYVLGYKAKGRELPSLLIISRAA